MPKVLGLDYGTKHIGVALSDETERLALARTTLTLYDQEAIIEVLRTLCREEQVRCIVIGLPLNQDGKIGPMAQQAQQFGAALQEALGIEVVFEDERFSTALAYTLGRQQKKSSRATRPTVDQQAARIILQTYLDKHHD